MGQVGCVVRIHVCSGKLHLILMFDKVLMLFYVSVGCLVFLAGSGRRRLGPSCTI